MQTPTFLHEVSCPGAADILYEGNRSVGFSTRYGLRVAWIALLHNSRMAVGAD